MTSCERSGGRWTGEERVATAENNTIEYNCERGTTMNILIVEDNANDRRLLRFTLEHHGCTVIEARDGREGLDLAIRHKPDIIVSDALMPHMDGFQLLRTLKADPRLKSIPFIFYSDTYTGEQEEKLA